MMNSSDHHLENVLKNIALTWGYGVYGEPAFGWHNKSIGQKAFNARAECAWLKLIFAETTCDKAWRGEIDASFFAF